ncbi:uncharacterized protein BDV17DRAFT_295485 [Aspergillus undulatus]|uniref:uncharacterized protein n=1 Tax=Aspergillus undulatus TaxID=1810928 RepID=UPI003CCDD246
MAADSSASSALRKKAKKAGAKKGKKTTGKKKKTPSSTSALQLPTPPPPAAFRPAPVYAPYPEQSIYMEKPGFILAGCVSTSAQVNDIFLAEWTLNETDDVSLRVGYFGGCVSITETNPPATSASTSTSNSNDNNQTTTHCVSNLRGKDLTDLNDDIIDDLDLDSTAAQATVRGFLNSTLPRAKHVQENIFFFQLPLTHIILSIISGIMLLVARTGVSHKKSFKGVMVLAIVLSGFALALALVTVLGPLSGLNALINNDSGEEERHLGNSLYIKRGKNMHALQAALVSIVGVFYILIGVLFVQWTPDVGVGFIVQAVQAVGRPLKRRRGGL